MSNPKLPSTHYLNVDLDVLSPTPLDGLATDMGPKAFVLYVGVHGRHHGAHFELASSHMGMSADKTIRGLVRLVQALPPSARKLWEQASTREFNIGIEAGFLPHGFEVRLKPETVESIVGIGGSLAITVYAPELGRDGRPRPETKPPKGAKLSPPGGRAKRARSEAHSKGRRTRG